MGQVYNGEIMTQNLWDHIWFQFDTQRRRRKVPVLVGWITHKYIDTPMNKKKIVFIFHSSETLFVRIVCSTRHSTARMARMTSSRVVR